MRRKILICFLFYISTLLYGYDFKFNQRYFLCDDYGELTIRQDKLIFNDKVEKGTLQSTNTFTTFMSDKNTYIILSCNINKSSFLTLVKKNDRAKEIFSSWIMPYVYDESESDVMPCLTGFDVVSASSHIKEKNKQNESIDYLPERFNLNHNPWAISSNEKFKTITLNIKDRNNRGYKKAPINEIVLINGFVNPEKQYLFEQNSRAKTIKITYGTTNFVYELKDTGDYQVIKLPCTFKINDKMTIEILDWYPGNKYSDIVLSGVLFIQTGYYE